MDLNEIERRLKNSLERTGYVSKIHIFFGEFYNDARYNKNPYITYIVDIKKSDKETEMHKLEGEIRRGLYKDRHENCHVRTCIEILTGELEKHSINVIFEDSVNPQEREKRTAKMAIHLKKIIDEYHYKK